MSGVKAHTGSDAAASARDMGAQAYATGDHVVLGDTTDLHTVAHEAAHIVQQRAGVHLRGGVGAVGDPYERHADAVADQVVQGKSAEALLDQYAGGGGPSSDARDEEAEHDEAEPEEAAVPQVGEHPDVLEEDAAGEQEAGDEEEAQEAEAGEAEAPEAAQEPAPEEPSVDEPEHEPEHAHAHAPAHLAPIQFGKQNPRVKVVSSRYKVRDTDIGTGTDTNQKTRDYVNGGGAPRVRYFSERISYTNKNGIDKTKRFRARNPRDAKGRWDAGHIKGRQMGGSGTQISNIFAQNPVLNRQNSRRARKMVLRNSYRGKDGIRLTWRKWEDMKRRKAEKGYKVSASFRGYNRR
ncbi:MAG TPA: DUF4157 domain-containing protein [Kofleriaceae bacterium]|nr:DUF4157 domain-containing protein [Kofleriaceae bacterium]